MRACKGSLVNFHSREYKKTYCWDLPSSPVVKTACFQYRGEGDQSLVGEIKSHMMHGMVRKQNKTKEAIQLIFPDLASFLCL